MVDRNTYSKQTNYPHIFEDTYWGRLDYNDKDEEEMTEIFQNRNKFVEDYNVKFNKNSDRYGKVVPPFDHNELYATDKGEYLFITSPYNHEKKEYFKYLGFTQISNMYSESAFTMLKNFPDKSAYLKFCVRLFENIHFADETNYPKIFQGTYWGTFRIDEKGHKYEDFEQIFQNRNKFVKEYNIKCRTKSKNFIPNYFDDTKFDHIEYYQTKGFSIIMIASPYTQYDDWYESNGFEKIYKLYHRSAFTYIKKFVNRKEFNAWTKKMLEKPI